MGTLGAEVSSASNTCQTAEEQLPEWTPSGTTLRRGLGRSSHTATYTHPFSSKFSLHPSSTPEGPSGIYGLWRIRDSWILPWTQCSCLLPARGLRAHSSGFQRGDCHPSGGVPPGRLARGVLCCFPPSLSECSKESSWGLLTRVQVSNSVTLELPKLDFICSSVCGQAGSSDF